MASINYTRCPNCGGPAYTCSDDGVTYCDAKDKNGNPRKCGYMDVEDHNKGYQPPSYRGG